MTFESVLKTVKVRFLCQPQYFCNVFTICGRRSTLEMSMCSLLGRRSTLDVSCCVLFADRIVRAASSGDHAEIPWQAGHIVKVSFGEDPSCVECHFEWQGRYLEHSL